MVVEEPQKQPERGEFAVEAGNEEQLEERQLRGLIVGQTIGIIGLCLIVGVGAWLLKRPAMFGLLSLGGVALVMGALAYGLLRWKRLTLAAVMYLFGTTLTITLLVFFRGFMDVAVIFYLWPIMAAPMLTSGWVTAALVVFALSAYISLALGQWLGYFPVLLPFEPQSEGLVFIGSTVVMFVLFSYLAMRTNRSLRLAVVQSQLAARQSWELMETLEKRVADRTRALATSAEISRYLSTILDQRQLVAAVVEQLRQAFDYYYVQIYLFDEAHENLILVGGTGEAGRALVARGHRLPRTRGLVGHAASTNSVVLVPDVSRNAVWVPNPLLPETKAEAAVPIAVGDHVLGVLDVQHNVVNGLQEQDAELIRTVANQVAVALQNAMLYELAQRHAARETLINTLSEKILNTTTIDDALQTAVRELGQVLGARRTSVQLSVPRRSLVQQVVSPSGGSAGDDGRRGD